MIVVGALMVLGGSAYTRRKVKGEFGDVTKVSMEMALLYRTVPKWVSLVVLGGYVVGIVGGIVLFLVG